MTLYTDETYGPRSAACKERTGHRCVVCCRRQGRHWWQCDLHSHHLIRATWGPLIALCARHHRAVHRWDKRIYGPPLWLVTYLYVVVRWTALGFAGCIVIGVTT